MAKSVTASAARANLFNLLDEVADATDEPVVIRRRGRPEGIALVRESRLRYLEARVKALEAKTPSKPFKLIGSLQIDGNVEEIIAANRAEQARLREKKWAEIFDDE